MKKIIGIYSLFCALQYDYAYGGCTFPNDLQGNWRGGKDADTKKDIIFRFDGDTIRDFALNLPGSMAKNNFKCLEKETNGDSTRFILKATEPLLIFNSRINLYFCLDIKDTQFAIRTGLEKYLNDKLYPGVMGKPIESELVCNSEQEPMTPMTKMTEESELERSRKLERLINELEERFEG